MNAEAITTAIRELIRGELGSVRTVPAGAWIEGVPAQLGMHGGLDGDTARRLRAEGRRLFDVEVAPARRTGSVGSSAASHSLLAITARVVLWLPITLVAETVSADHRYAARADALEQAQVIREAIEWPGNLTATADGTLTGIVSGRLGEAQTPRIVREDWSRGLYEIELRFSGYVKRSAETPAAPVFVRPPSAYVVDAEEAAVGGVLVADPGEVTGAHTTRGQWLRDGAEIEGETRVLYEIVEPDEGAALSYRATAIGSGGTVSTESNAIILPSYDLLTGGLIAWFEAGLTGLDGNGQLAQFDDASGAGNHLACPAALGARPVVAPKAAYGYTPVVSFAGGVGTGQYAARATWTQGSQAQPTCLVFVGDVPDNVAGSARTVLDGGTNGFRQALRRQNNSMGGFDMAALTSLPSGDTRTTPCIMWLIFGGVSSAIYIEDPTTPKATGDAGAQAINGMTMAAGWGSTVASICNVWGAGVYKANDVGDFSESWRRAVGAYVYKRTNGAVGVAP